MEGELGGAGARATPETKVSCSAGNLLFFRTCRHSGVMGGALDFDRACERTSMMQRVTWGGTQKQVGKAGINGMADYSTQSCCCPERPGYATCTDKGSLRGRDIDLLDCNETSKASPQSNARKHRARITLRREINTHLWASWKGNGVRTQLSSGALNHQEGVESPGKEEHPLPPFSQGWKPGFVRPRCLFLLSVCFHFLFCLVW